MPLVVISKYSKFNVDTFCNVWKRGYIKVFARCWCWLFLQNKKANKNVCLLLPNYKLVSKFFSSDITYMHTNMTYIRSNFILSDKTTKNFFFKQNINCWMCAFYLKIFTYLSFNCFILQWLFSKQYSTET
jgi:hypothetical protein